MVAARPATATGVAGSRRSARAWDAGSGRPSTSWCGSCAGPRHRSSRAVHFRGAERGCARTRSTNVGSWPSDEERSHERSGSAIGRPAVVELRGGTSPGARVRAAAAVCARISHRDVRHEVRGSRPEQDEGLVRDNLAAKTRVHELAKELGLTNKECLDLCLRLGIGVKTHSSGIEEAQADRVRRRAQRDGLVRDKQPEPTPAETAPATAPVRRVPPPPAPARPGAGRPSPSTPPAPPNRLVTSSGSEHPPRPLRPDLTAPPPGAPHAPAASAAPPAPPAAPDRPAGPAPRPSRPTAPAAAHPTPPPPGQGGRTRTAPRRGGRPGGGPPGRGRPAGVGGGGGGSSRPFAGGPGAGRPGGGPPMGGPGGAPGGRPGGGPRGGGQRPPRRRGRRRRSREELQPMEVPTYTPASAPVPEGVIVVERASTPQDLGPKLNRTAADVVRFLMQQGEMVTATQSLTDDMIELFAAEIGAEIRLVDPGKTKLLDRIRNANVVEGEAGGITQHIGAYQAEKNGRPITFIDTPGHEAFTAMRARGAQATDIVVLVVAADDGVMPQTLEALNHAKAAEVPIVVAINKVDREEANPDRVKQQLSEQDLIPSDWGGDVEMVPVSALQGLGIDELLETLLLVADVQDPPIAASAAGRAAGVVLEANLDVGRGPVASILVQRGTLRVGDPLVAGAAWGRVRALIDDHGHNVKEAGPSTPVQVLGLNEVADAGDQFVVAPDERLARSVAETREHWQRLASLGREAAVNSGGAKLEDIFQQIRQGEVATLNLVLKADVTGKLERDDVKLSFVQRGVGGITKSDVQLAAASNATIIGFNVRPDRTSRELAMAEDVEIRTYEIIYQVLEDIENALVGLLQPEFEEVVTGEAEVREIFSVPRVGKIAGCYVTNGVITRGSKVRFLRDGTVIWKGTVSSLKRFKEDAREVQSGFECGIGLSDFQDLKQGDIIETFEEREIPRT